MNLHAKLARRTLILAGPTALVVTAAPALAQLPTPSTLPAPAAFEPARPTAPC